MELAKNSTTENTYTLTLAGWEAEALLRELGGVPRSKRTVLGDMAAGLLREAAVDAGHTVRTRRGAPTPTATAGSEPGTLS
ncbi:hypothetical protein [Streptomyces cyaneofuscatus]|uniref:hypothetical protein n=1 Tax=Streptomyces cyaneofuscatus TaxID=66883 RepID=UPI00379E84E2|nr:hypothetical protein OG973_36175 [Streptomyces cyaneofuscatus]